MSSMALLLGCAVLGGSCCKDKEPPPPGPLCDACGVTACRVSHLVVTLGTSPSWRVRDDAACALRSFDWRSHPEAVGALAAALLSDPHEEVREAAAQSLCKLAPCLPEAHLAVSHAAMLDPDWTTRWHARWAARKLNGKCQAPCSLCDPEAGAIASGSAPIRILPNRPFPPGTSPELLPTPQPSLPWTVDPPATQPYGTDEGGFDLPAPVVPAPEVMPPPPGPGPFGEFSDNGDPPISPALEDKDAPDTERPARTRPRLLGTLFGRR